MTGGSSASSGGSDTAEHPCLQNDVESLRSPTPAAPSTSFPYRTSRNLNSSHKPAGEVVSAYDLLYPGLPCPVSSPRPANAHLRGSCRRRDSSIRPSLFSDRNSHDHDHDQNIPSPSTGLLYSDPPPNCADTAAASLASSQRPATSIKITSSIAWGEFLVLARRAMDYLNEGAELARSMYNAMWHTAGAVWRTLTSKAARRTVLTTILVNVASAFLFGLACFGYLAFYHEYLPDQVTTLPVHLQYGYEMNPYGVVSLANVNVKDYQDYDMSVTLNLPRSPANLGRGNFMIALHLLDNKAPSLLPVITPLPIPGPQSVLEGRNILHTSARPAIVPYTDPLVSLASRLLFLAYHVFVPHAETTKLVVPMVERLEFRPGKMSPTSLVLDVQAGQTLQVYSAFVTITAQLHGLRWFMHTYWMSSFVIFTTLFWFCELFFAGIMVLFLGLVFGGSSSKSSKMVKQEGDDSSSAQPTIKREEGMSKSLEDVPMTFPTSSRQAPLRYDPEPSVASGATPQTDLPPGGEADDEEENEEEEYETQFHDSGIGTTSFSERDGPGSLRRRSSRARGRD